MNKEIQLGKLKHIDKNSYFVIDVSDETFEHPIFGPFSNKKEANKWITKDYKSIMNDGEIGDYTIKYLLIQIKDMREVYLKPASILKVKSIKKI
jgi:hypothetical protein